MVLYRDRDRISGPQASVRPELEESSSESDSEDSSDDEEDFQRYGGGMGKMPYGPNNLQQAYQEKMQKKQYRDQRLAERKVREKMKRKADKEEENRAYGLFMNYVPLRSPAMRPVIGFH